MDIDWVLGIAVFLFFVAWSFTFYFSVFRFDQNYLDTAADIEMGKILDYISIPVYSAPIFVNSSVTENDVILYSGYVGYAENRNTTRVRSMAYLPCIISGNNTYWKTNLYPGEEEFAIEIADTEAASPLCTGNFSLAGARQVVPRALEETSRISTTKIADINAMGYDNFRKEIRTTQDFRLELEDPFTNSSFGKPLPQGAENVFVRKSGGVMWEMMFAVNVTFYIW
jgi:hypothetical protein